MGKRNLEKAARFSNIPVNVQWLPFFLSPDTPPEGKSLSEHLLNKFGAVAVEKFLAPGNPLTVAGEKAGITFNNERRFINTVDCHLVLELCRSTIPSKANSLMEQLFHAYFEQGLDISKRNVLMAVAISAGLEEAALIRTLETEREKTTQALFGITKHTKTAWRVSGVPFFVVEMNDGSKPITFAGAQPADFMTEVLEAAK